MREILCTSIVLLAAAGARAEEAADPLEAKAQSRSSMDAAALVELGHLYVEAMRLDDAKEIYRDALGLEKGYGEAEYGLAKIDMAKGKFDKAKNACRGVWRRHKTESVGDVCSGWFWLSNDRSARAKDEFLKAIGKGDLKRGKTGMGEALRRRAEYEAAIASYREALDAGAGYVAEMGMGLALSEKGDKGAATAALERAVRAEPASCLAHYHLGRILGSGAKAASHLRAALEIRPGWADAYHALGKVLLENGDNAGAEQAFRSAIEAEANRGTAFLGLGQALHAQGKSAEARESLEKAIEMVPNLVDAYLLLADILYESGEEAAALESLDKAKAVAPGVVRVYLHSGELYYRIGRATMARTFLQQAVSMKKDLSLAHVILGDIACGRRLYDDGQAHYADALAGDMEGVTAADVEQRKAACRSPH